MTPDQLRNNLFTLTTVGLTLLFETLAWRLAPALIARIAYVPLSTRRSPLSAGARVALMALMARAEHTSYRMSGFGAIDWSHLPGPRRFEMGGARIDLDLASARVVIRLPFHARWFAFGGVAILRLRVKGDTAILTSRAIPFLSLTSIAFFGSLLVLLAAGGPWRVGVVVFLVFLLFNAVAVIRTRQFAAPIMAIVENEIESRIAHAEV